MTDNDDLLGAVREDTETTSAPTSEEAAAGADTEAPGEATQEPETPSRLATVFTEPAEHSPTELDGHDVVQLIKNKFDGIASSPKAAFEYLLKAGISLLDSLGLPVGGKKNLPSGIYVLIGIVAVCISLFRRFTGTEEADDQDDEDEDLDDVLEDAALKGGNKG